MAVPKKKMSRSRTRQRKATWKLTRRADHPLPAVRGRQGTTPGLSAVRHLQRAGRSSPAEVT